MAIQSIYLQKAVDLLKDEVINGISLDKYKEDRCPFQATNIAKLVGVPKPEGLQEKLLECPSDEYKCAIILYEAFKGLTALQASDERLWVYLAHVDLYNYVRARWKVENSIVRTNKDGSSLTQDESDIKFILDHWFGGHSRHALASLWWSVYLTIDNDREDPYELTKFLFEHYDFRTRRFTSSVFSRNREGMIGLLTGMMSLDTYKESFECRSNFAIMYFNYLGGTRQLSALDRNFFTNELIRIDSEVQKYKSRDDISKNKDHLFDNLSNLDDGDDGELFVYNNPLQDDPSEPKAEDNDLQLQENPISSEQPEEGAFFEVNNDEDLTQNQDSNLNQKPYQESDKSSSIAAEPKPNDIGLIIEGYKNLQLRKRFALQLQNEGLSRYIVDEYMRHFYTKVIDAINAGAIGVKIKKCSKVDEFKLLLDNLFEAWKYNLKYKEIPELFYKYLNFLQDYFMENGSFDTVDTHVVIRDKKIVLQYEGGQRIKMQPTQALRFIIGLFGSKAVSELNLKVPSGDKLLVPSKPYISRYYEELNDGWWVNTSSTTKEKYKYISYIVQHFHPELKISME